MISARSDGAPRPTAGALRLTAARSENPTGIDVDDYRAELFEHCPFLQPSMTRGMTGWTVYEIAPGAHRYAVEAELFHAGVQAAEWIRPLMARPHGLLTSENVVLVGQCADAAHRELLAWPHRRRVGRPHESGGRVIGLRELTPDDAIALQNIYGPESTRYLGRGAMDAAEARSCTRDAVAAAGHFPRTLYTLGLARKSDLLGVVKLRLDRPAATVSYILRADAWGQGYATEGARRILALGFGHLGLPVVHAKHHPDNPASGRVLTKAGFTWTGQVSGFETYLARPQQPPRTGHFIRAAARGATRRPHAAPPSASASPGSRSTVPIFMPPPAPIPAVR
ncbi:GNAT family N-acetyltransferase [Kitasatospora sp. NPDC091207]|uniref:GNAT family N-acetyltransferase n=1 Tax=Kitasatospora sp. NPDC091207 TaxID=3364083 RepID=UPI003828D0B0